MKNLTAIISMGNVINEITEFLLNEMPPASPVVIDGSKCTGCNNCVNICQVDIFVPNLKKGGSPLVMYPGECWYCGCCVAECPHEGAIELRHPLMNRARWISKDELK